MELLNNIIATSPLNASSILQKFGIKSSYGIYFADSGAVAIKCAFTAFDITQDSRITQSPQEQGSFNSSDKVQTPFVLHIKIVPASGTTGADLISTLTNLSRQALLYKVVTPKATYNNVDLTKMSFSETTEAGMTLVEASVDFTEIRMTARQVSSPASPNGADVVENGLVQAVVL